MMKVAFVAVLLFLVCYEADADDAAAPPLPDLGPPIKWPAQPEPELLQIIARLLPPLSDPKVKKCLGEGPGVQSCVHDISVSFVKHHISLKPDCCKIIHQLKGDCYTTVFDGFKNPFFNLAVKNQCAAAVAAPPPKP